MGGLLSVELPLYFDNKGQVIEEHLDSRRTKYSSSHQESLPRQLNARRLPTVIIWHKRKTIPSYSVKQITCFAFC